MSKKSKNTPPKNQKPEVNTNKSDAWAMGAGLVNLDNNTNSNLKTITPKKSNSPSLSTYGVSRPTFTGLNNNNMNTNRNFNNNNSMGQNRNTGFGNTSNFGQHNNSFG